MLREGLGQGAEHLGCARGRATQSRRIAGGTDGHRATASQQIGGGAHGFVETAGSLPPDETGEALDRGRTRCRAVAVRRFAAELVAELSESVDLGPRLALLAHLNRDRSPMVRTRAAVLLSRLLHETRDTKTPPPKRAPAAPSRTFSPDDAKPTPPTPAAPESKPPGELSLAAANPILFRIDGETGSAHRRVRWLSQLARIACATSEDSGTWK